MPFGVYGRENGCGGLAAHLFCGRSYVWFAGLVLCGHLAVRVR